MYIKCDIKTYLNCHIKEFNKIKSKTIKKNHRGKITNKKENSPLGETLEVIMHELVQQELIKINDSPIYGEPSFKLPWYNKYEQCEFPKIKGHTTNRCDTLKNIIQDIIDQGEIAIKGPSTKDDNDNVSTSRVESNDQELSTTDHIENFSTSSSEQEDIHQEFSPKHDQNKSPKYSNDPVQNILTSSNLMTVHIDDQETLKPTLIPNT